jgi:hypothetical protein
LTLYAVRINNCNVILVALNPPPGSVLDDEARDPVRFGLTDAVSNVVGTAVWVDATALLASIAKIAARHNATPLVTEA